MSAPNSLRCLLRPAAAIPQRIAAAAWNPSTPAAAVAVAQRTAAAPFSTTARAARVNKVAAAKPMADHHIRTGKKMQVKKKKVVGRQGKTPLPGERKAMRKRIQLTNNNALPVPWVAELGPADMLNSKNVGKVMSIPGPLQDQLRVVEAFKPTQFWNMFRAPSMLIRSETVDVIQRMQDAADKKKTLRLVISGDRVTGKSMLLLQSMTHALSNEWLVINIPEAQELTTACTEYAPIPETDPVQYMQNNYCLKLIQSIRKANEKILARLTTAYSHTDLPQNIPINSTLLQLTNSAKEPEGAWLVFQALWKELMAKGQPRPPILFSLDGLPHIMKISDYRSPAFELIHSQDLSLVRIFTDALSGATPFPNGGAVLAATSRGNAPRSPSMDLALARREAEQAGTEPPKAEPYHKGYDLRSEEALKTVDVLRLKGVSKLETRSLLEYWAASGVLRAKVDETTVGEKWTLGGHGIVGEMERASLSTMRIG